jgi:phage terminase large subunit
MTATHYKIRQGDGAGGPVLRGGALDLWRYRGPEVILAGPSETGKTTACLHKLNALLWKYRGAQAVLVRKVRDTIYGTVLQTFIKKILKEGDDVRPYGGEHPQWFDYPFGSRLWLAGMDRPDKALSSERDFVYVNQAEELDLDDWQVLTTRATGRAGGAPYGQVMGDANPGPPWHWIKQRATLHVVESRHTDNPLLYDDAGNLTEQGKRTMAALDALTGVRRERLKEGRWVSAEGVVYQFDPRHHVVARSAVPPARFAFASVDWGLKNPGVLQVWQVDGDGRMYLVHEVYRTGQLIDWWADRAKEAKARYGIECCVCDPSEPAYVEQFIRAGVYAVAGDNAVRPGISAVEARLALAPDGRPRLFFVQDCLAERDETLAEARKPCSTRDEMDVYSWPKDVSGRPVKDVPVKANDHGCDALRYACRWADARMGFDPRQISSGGGPKYPDCVFGGARGAFGAGGDARHPPRF